MLSPGVVVNQQCPSSPLSMTGLVRYVSVSVCWGLLTDLGDPLVYNEILGLSSSQQQQQRDRRPPDLIGQCLAQMEAEGGVIRKDLQGAVIPIALTNYPPFLEILKKGDAPATSSSSSPPTPTTSNRGRGGGVEGRGMSWQLMMTLATYYNFTPDPLVADEGVIGRKDKNGEWRGALQLVQNKSAEMTLMPVTVTKSVQELVDISLLLGTTTFGILVKRPEYSPKPDALLRPFSYEVWWWILGATAVMGPLIYFIIVFRVQLCKGDPTLTRIFPFHQCVWFVYGAMMKQGSVLKPISDSSRILFATWWLFIMIVTSFYTANLTAFLTFNGLELPITRVADLTRVPDLTWLAFEDGALIDIIATHPKLQIMRDLQQKGRGRFINNREEAVEMVRKGGYVFVDHMQVLDHLIQEDFKKQRRLKRNQTCNFYTAPFDKGRDFTFWFGYGFSKDSQYKDLFNSFFRRISFFGILNFLRDNATASGPVCSLPKGFTDRPLKNKDLHTTYIVTALGIAASCISLIFEYFCRRARRREKAARHFTHNNNINNNNKTHQHHPIFSITVPPKSSVLRQRFQWENANLPPLPDTSPRQPFEVRYPQFAGHPHPPMDNLELPTQHQMLTGKMDNTRRFVWDERSHMISNRMDSSHIVTREQRNGGHLTETHTEPAVTRVKPTGTETRTDSHTHNDVITGTINHHSATWDQSTGTLILEDPRHLAGNVAYIDGVPYTFLRYQTRDGPRLQKMILNDMI